MYNKKRLLALAVSAALAAPATVFATNGMNLEGYGPIATGMGGASMAYDNGTAAVMNNPATLGLMEEGSRFDIAIGNLGPDVSVKSGGTTWDSGSDSFMMPAFGWVRKSGSTSFGVGVMAQGGMGTSYSGGGTTGAPGGAMSAQMPGANIANLIAQSGIPNHQSMDFSTNTPVTDAALSGALAQNALALDEFSEVSVGRMVFPFVVEMSRDLSVGASLDFVWAGMDLQMAMDGGTMGDMMPFAGSTQQAGEISGGLVNGMGGMFFDPTVHNDPTNPALYGISGLNWGYFDFANDNDYTGEATATGFAGKLGFTYRLSRSLTIGGTFHSKTSLGDLEASGANVGMNVLMSSYTVGADATPGTADDAIVTGASDIAMKGTIKVKDFQWPQTIGLGLAYQPNDSFMFVADVKQIGWADVMKDFTMEFVADSITMGGQDVTGMFASTDMSAKLYQDWDDQLVTQIGAAFGVTDSTTLRVGYNHSTMPTQDETVHYLFPAITETHYTFGVGQQIGDSSAVDFSLSYVPESTQDMMGGQAEVSMSQMNWQLMYSSKY